MGGAIGVKSTIGQGSTFWFSVRFQKGLGIRPAASTHPFRPPLQNGSGCHEPLRVLVVDDNPVNQKVASLQLRKIGCKIEVANNGLEAVANWQRNPSELIFMDCQMPGMDGFEAAKTIRSLENERSSPARVRIIAMTAAAMEGDRESCLGAGMDDYISKPVSGDQLGALLQRHFPERFRIL